jgi:GTP-binding protein EngB required for normal cell division
MTDERSPRSALAAIGALACEAGFSKIAIDADALAGRLAEGRFYVACLGQFKRGKSTLLNALVGSSVLPTGVAPVTSVVTVLRHGEEIAVRVRAAEAGWRDVPPESLRDYVSEERNPGNTKRVTGVEVFHPAPLLRRGLCLVDTPGIGSVFPENTTSTREFLPHLDAALIVLGADPPVTGDELALIEDVARRVPHRLFVLAKADRLSDTERQEARIFTERVLADRLETEARQLPQIFEVSAMEVSSSGQPTRDWSSLVRALDDLAARAGSDLVAAAERRGTAALLDHLLAATDQQIGALERPLAESEAGVAALGAGLASAERALRDLSPLFAAEEARLYAAVERLRNEWLHDSAASAKGEIERTLRPLHERGPALRARAVDEATAVARRWLADWRAREGPNVDRLFRAGMQRFVDLLATVETALVSAAGAQGARSLAIEPALRAPSHFYMTEMLTAAPTSVGKHLLDAVGVTSARRNDAIRGDAIEYLGRLLDVNSERLKNDFRERLAVSRRALEAEVRDRLHDIGESAQQSLTRARALQQAGHVEVDTELERLRSLRARAQSIRSRLKITPRAAGAGAS